MVVFHRRSGHESVTVRYSIELPAGARTGVLRAQLGDDPVFGDLADRLGDSLLRAAEVPSAGVDPPGDADLHFHHSAGDGGPNPPSDGPGAPLVRATTGPDGAPRFAATDADGSPDPHLLRQLTAAAAAAGDQRSGHRISVLPLVTAEDEAELTGMNGAGAAVEKAGCVHDLFRDQVRSYPAAPAVAGDREILTYRELDERSDRIAHALVAHGVRPGAVVGVQHQRSVRLVALLLGILKAGACYLAIDPADPPARRRQLLELAEASHVVLQDGEQRTGEDRAVTLDAARLADARPARPGPFPCPPLGPDALAYISCTSGSTGEPKAVGVPHRAVARLLRRADWFEAAPGDVFLQVAPVAFDASTIEVWGPLLNGATVAVYPGDPGDVEQLGQEIVACGVTVLLLTTGLLNQMINSQLPCFGKVRHVLTGGDVASPPHIEKLLQAHPHLVFTNGYGPTENTSYTTCWTVHNALVDGTVPIGTPINGTRIAVLDAALRPVPVGVCGELYASGDGLARGYIGRPGATAERFVADPFGRPGERMYRTGDLVRRRADGALDFLGRTDQQVKVRGFRVEPGHIEAVLTSHPDVAAAAVVPQQDPEGSRRLLAYVVAEEGPAAEDLAGLSQRLTAMLHSRLPAYMVPWAVLAYPQLPLNRNGKLDRRSLPAVDRLPRALPAAYVPPRTPLERRLADIWGEILGVEPVGIEDDFFALGGYSLLAAKLLAVAQRDLGVEIPARALYLRPTIAGIVAELADR